MKQPLSQEEISGLIGRPLSSYETTNFVILSELTTERLDTLLAGGLAGAESWTSGLKMLFARMFELAETERTATPGVKRKSVDGYSVEYKDEADGYVEFLKANAGLIAKYKTTGAGIRHGKTIYEDFRYIYHNEL